MSAPAFPPRTGDEAKRLRNEIGLNQKDFWSRVGITQSGGSRYESGRDIPEPVQILLHLAYGPYHEASRLFAAMRKRPIE